MSAAAAGNFPQTLQTEAHHAEEKSGHSVVSSSPSPSSSVSSAAGDGSSVSARPASFFDLRIAVVGNVDSGKSTIIGVLTGGVLDNGRGQARSRVFLHKHESVTGRTSCISQHIMGYDQSLAPVFNSSSASSSAAVKNKSWSSVVTGSSHTVTFIDLAGHERYLKTTIAGLTGCFPDYALIVINSLAGVTKMSREHLGVVLALSLPLLVVVTKVDLASDHVLGQTRQQLFKVLKSGAANKLPVQMRSGRDVDMVITAEADNLCPVFFVSCVTGVHIPLLHDYIARLRQKRQDWLRIAAGIDEHSAGGSVAGAAGEEGKDGAREGKDEPDTGDGGGCEFLIDETFLVTGVGVVVSGTVQRGRMHSNCSLLLGPQSDGSFKPVYVRTLHCKRMAVEAVQAGDSCAASLRAMGRKEHLTRASIRRGMCLIDSRLQPQASTVFDAEVHILHHPTTIKLGYQAVIHAGMVRQAATIVRISPTGLAASVSASSPSPSALSACLRTGDRALVRFRFLLRPEYLHVGASFLFREGSTKGIGRVSRCSWSREELRSMQEADDREKRERRPAGKTAAAATAGAAAGPHDAEALGTRDEEEKEGGSVRRSADADANVAASLSALLISATQPASDKRDSR